MILWRPLMKGAAAIVVGLLALLGSAAADEVYVNGRFGLMVPIPPGLQECSILDEWIFDGAGQSHGTTIFLDPAGPQICINEVKPLRFIEDEANYNVSYHTTTLAGLKRTECDITGHGHCVPAPKGLRFRGSPSASFRVDQPDGWIDIVVVTQAGRFWTHYPDDPKYAVNYISRLHTDPAHLAQDLDLFRKHVHAIRLIPLE